MTLTREQLHNLRSKLGTIALATDVTAAYTNADGKKYLEMIRANVAAANRILDGLTEEARLDA